MSEAKKLTIRNTDGGVPIYNWNDKTEVAIKRVLREGEHYKNMMTVYRLIGSEYLGVSNFCGGQQKNDAKKCLLQYARIEKVEKGKNEVCCYEIYPIPRLVVKPDGRGQNGVYIDRLVPIAVSYFHSLTNSQFETTVNNLAFDLGMVKMKYKFIWQAETYEELYQTNEKYTPAMINQFYARSQKTLQRVMYTALDRLQNKMKVISYTREYTIIFPDDTARVATDEERKWIEEAEDLALDTFEATSKYSILHGKRKDNYYRWVIAYINDEHEVSWDQYHKRIHITIHKDALNDAYDAQSPQNLMTYRKELKEHFANAVFSTTQKNYNSTQDKAEEKITEQANKYLLLNHELAEWNDLGIIDFDDLKREASKALKKEKKLFKYHPTYIPVQKGLIEHFIGHVEEKG